MAQNVVINGVTYSSVPKVQIPLSGESGNAVFWDTADGDVTAGSMLSGVVGYSASGKITGNIATKTSSNMTVSGATVTAPAGYYASSASKSVSSGSATTPTTTISATATLSVDDETGIVSASVSGSQSITPTISAGYVSSGTAGTVSVSGSGTLQLDTVSATTYTPGTSDQTVSAGQFLIGDLTITGDSDLVASNIKSGASIFGVSGSSTVVDTTIASGGAGQSQIMSGYSAYVNGSLVNGAYTGVSVSQDSSTKVLTIS